MTTGYCMKCRKKVEIKNPRVKKNKRDIRVAEGTCSKCGTKVYRIIGKWPFFGLWIDKIGYGYFRFFL